MQIKIKNEIRSARNIVVVASTIAHLMMKITISTAITTAIITVTIISVKMCGVQSFDMLSLHNLQFLFVFSTMSMQSMVR